MNIQRAFKNDKRPTLEKKEELFNFLVCIDGGRSVLEMLISHFGIEMVQEFLKEYSKQMNIEIPQKQLE